MKVLMTIASFAAASFLSIGMATAQKAQTILIETPSHFDRSSVATADYLIQRIEGQARRICGDFRGVRQGSRRSELKRCVADVTAEAVMKSGDPMLQRRHAETAH